MKEGRRQGTGRQGGGECFTRSEFHLYMYVNKLVS